MHKAFLLLLLSSSLVAANDGVFYASGDMLFPLEKTSIAMRKEILTITKQGDSILVDVYFEFDNPGAVQTLIVGFVTPPGGGDVSDMPFAHSDTLYDADSRVYIHDFTVTMNGASLPSNAQVLGRSGFKLPNKSFGDEYEYVYCFTATFKPGANTIHHTYWMPLSSNVDEEFTGLYRLTTGRSWANKQIDDFTLNLHFGAPQEFYLSRSFWKNKKTTPWKIVGRGSIKEEGLAYRHEPPLEITYINLTSGYVQFKAKHFKPDYDLSFGKLNQEMLRQIDESNKQR